MSQPSRFVFAAILVVFLGLGLGLTWYESNPASAAPAQTSSSSGPSSLLPAAGLLAPPASPPAGPPPGTGPHARPIPPGRAFRLNADLRTLAPVGSAPLVRPKEA